MAGARAAPTGQLDAGKGCPGHGQMGQQRRGPLADKGPPQRRREEIRERQKGSDSQAFTGCRLEGARVPVGGGVRASLLSHRRGGLLGPRMGEWGVSGKKREFPPGCSCPRSMPAFAVILTRAAQGRRGTVWIQKKRKTFFSRRESGRALATLPPWVWTRREGAECPRGRELARKWDLGTAQVDVREFRGSRGQFSKCWSWGGLSTTVRMGTQGNGEPLKAPEQESTQSRACEKPHGPKARDQKPSLEVAVESLRQVKRPDQGL